MSSSTKFNFSSSFADGSTHLNGQRGSHAAPSLERLGSFREGNENRISSSLISTSRTVSMSSQTDGISLLHTVVSDVKTTVLDQKLPRPGEMKKSMTSILGKSAEDSLPVAYSMKPLPSSSMEEIKRLKSHLLDGSVKARDRAKVFDEASFKMDKFYHHLPRKRSRNDNSSIDRSHVTMPGGSSSKVGGPQGHLIVGTHEHGSQKSEERAKSAVPNRRMRTSLVEMDVRANSIVKQSGLTDKERDMFKFVSGGVTQSEENGRGLSTVGDGWDKSKMKKKRSVIKSDSSGGAVLPRLHDSDREPKRGMQQRLVIDSRPRPNTNHGVRSNNRAASPTPVMKMNTPVRGSRSNLGSVSKAASPDSNGMLEEADWEHTQRMNKPNGLLGAGNRKRSASVLSSSPPVAHWGGQRPQKITRVARRSNLPPVVLSRDESRVLEMHDSAAIINDGLGLLTRTSPSFSQQSKSKGEQVLSESEESGVFDNKSKDNGKKYNENEDKSGSSIQKATALVPSRKNRVSAEEDQETRRHGKIGRGVSPGRSVMTTMEKIDSAATTKQMRSARSNNEKNDSKQGHPLTKKWTERKGSCRTTPSPTCGSLDLTGESDDDYEELLSAANFVMDTGKACSGTFWKKTEEIFGFVSVEDTDFLHEQIRLTQEPIVSTCGTGNDPSPKDDLEYNSGITSVSSINGYSGSSNGNSRLNVRESDSELASQTKTSDPINEDFLRENGIPGGLSICQALLSAFIGEEEIENLEHEVYGKDHLYVNGYISSGADREFMSASSGLHSLLTVQDAERPGFISSKVNTCWVYNDGPVFERAGSTGMLDESVPSLATTARTICSDFQYNQMSIDDRILLELSAIGVYPEPLAHLEPCEDENIDDSINILAEKLNEQVVEKKRLLAKLEKNVMEERECQQRKLESMAMDKLLENAYEKYKAIRGSGASVSRNVSRTNKQANQALIERTLARYQKFEKTKISCFGVPPFKDMFLTPPSHKVDAGNTGLYENRGVGHQLAPSRHLDASLTDKKRGLVSQSARELVHGKYSEAIRTTNNSTDQICGTENLWSNKLKKKELLLDDVVGSALRAPSGLGISLASGIKGKRSDRDSVSRNNTAKNGRQAALNAKIDKKNKSKSKQKSQLSASVNDLIGKASRTPNKIAPAPPRSHDITGASAVQDLSNNAEAMDLSNLEMDVTDFGAQGQDIGSWLNIEDDGLHDLDFMGLQIPMDDLSEVL